MESGFSPEIAFYARTLGVIKIVEIS